MIPAVLRIILDGEDAGVRPKRAAAHGFGNLPKRKVIVRHLRGGLGLAGFCPAGVIVRQPENREVRKAARLLKAFQFVHKARGAVNIRHVQIPARRVRHRERPERFDVRFAPIGDRIRAVHKIAVAIEKLGLAFLRGVFPFLVRRGEFAEVAHRFAVRERIVPDETRR